MKTVIKRFTYEELISDDKLYKKLLRLRKKYGRMVMQLDISKRETDIFVIFIKKPNDRYITVGWMPIFKNIGTNKYSVMIYIQIIHRRKGLGTKLINRAIREYGLANIMVYKRNNMQFFNNFPKIEETSSFYLKEDIGLNIKSK